MKKLTLIVLSLFLVSSIFFASMALAKRGTKAKNRLLSGKRQQKISKTIQKKQPPKELVTYFSATGHTADVAKALAKILNAPIVEIVPAQPYSGADLDWRAKHSRASKEHADPAARPAIREANLALEQFDTIYLGFPIWWGDVPRIILTYIETHDLANKKIILFATSGGSGFGDIALNLQVRLPKSKVIEGKVFPGFIAENDIENQINDWLKTLKK